VLDLYVAYRNTHQVLAVAYLTASGLIMAVVVVLVGRSWVRYSRVRKVNTFQSLAAQAHLGKTSEAQNKRLLRMIRSYATRHGRTGPASTRRDANRLCAKLATYEDASQAVSDLEEYLLQTMDRQADQIVLQRAAQTALGTAMAVGRMDGLIVLWQSMSLVGDISTLYAGRPGFLGTVRLLRRALAMTVLAEIAEQATELLADAIANKAAAKLGGRTVQGFGNGLLMVRLGNALKKQCRPVLYTGSRLSAMALATEILGTFKNRKKNSPALDGEET
jgi:putative membrane protein